MCRKLLFISAVAVTAKIAIETVVKNVVRYVAVSAVVSAVN